MTWVIGATSVFGYGALYSDVQVTFADGSTKDILQKAYPLSNFLAAGFAGSVRIGFMLLQSLADFVHLPDAALATQAWDPVWVSQHWAPIARKVFESAPLSEQALGARILMLGASPSEPAGLGSRMFLSRFAEPTFVPGIMGRFVMSCSIGSGAGVAAYKRWIKPHIRFMSGIHKAEVMNPNGWAQQLAFSISRAVAANPHSGISRHFHAVVVRRGQLSVWNNDETVYHPDGTVVQVRMPPVAQRYEEFLQQAASIGRDPAGASS